MANWFSRIVPYSLLLLVLVTLSFTCMLSGCKDDDDDQEPSTSETGLVENVITISDISGVPDGVVFDRVVVAVKGGCWDVVATVEAPYVHGSAVLKLPATFSSDKLQQSVRLDKRDVCGHWPVTTASTDSDARVAKLDDILVYNGDVKVGRVYVSDWSGEGSTGGKGFVYYYYADRPFVLSGGNSSVLYSASFVQGWNAIVQFNAATPGGQKPATCTSVIPNESQLHWLFEKH